MDNRVTTGNKNNSNSTWISGPETNYEFNYRFYALSEKITVPSEPIPEPLTILGTATALGFGAMFKRKNTSTQETD